MKRLLVLCLMVAMLTTAGCGGGSDSSDKKSGDESSSGSKAGESVKADVAITEAGYLAGYVFAYVQNRENREVVVDVKYGARDASGAPVDLSNTGRVGYDVLPPSSTILLAQAVPQDNLTQVSADPRPVKATVAAHETGAFEATVARLELGFLPKHVVASIKSTYPQAVESAAVAMMCKDSAGQRVAAGMTRFSVAANGVTEKKIGVAHNAGVGTTSCELFPYITTTTSFR